jgi:phosphoribosylanthranilate isomerase
MSTLVQVKICGITSSADLRAAADCGADAVGLNFWPQSKRAVSVAQAQKIVKNAPPFLQLVGVFVNAPLKYICQVVDAVGLHVVQLHGDETVSDYRPVPVPLIRAFAACDAAQVRRTFRREAPHVAALLVDAPQASYGGSGVTFAWSLLQSLARPRPLILAGGLTPQNVARAVRTVSPDAVDVASGVESAPGRKDAKKMNAFIRQAKGY